MKLRLKIAGTLGILLTAFQISLACIVASRNPHVKSLSESYSSLCRWDCGWYAGIAEYGYRSTVPPVAQNSQLANVAFFPGYPKLGGVVSAVLSVRPEIALLIVAQFFSVLFWAALWLLLTRWRIPRAVAALVVFAILCHPASFFLVSGYSESLFLSSLLIFILYGPVSGSAGRRFSAIVAGFAMSLTRIVGVAAAAFPIVSSLGISRKGILKKGVLTTAAVAGAVSFLIYCQLRFGQYDLYMQTQKIGWGIVPDYGAIWKWGSFRYSFGIDAFTTRASYFAFLILAQIEGFLAWITRRSGFVRRLPVYATAFLIFYVSLSGLKAVEFRSMIRYSLPWYILLLLCSAHLSVRLWRRSRLRQLPKAFGNSLLVAIALIFAAVFWMFDIPYLREFVNGRWFA